MSEDLLTEGLTRVRLRFLDSLCGCISRTTHLRAQLTKRIEVKDSLSEIGQICHKIAGTAATLGFPELGATASKIDDFIMADIDSQDDPDPYLLAEIDQLLKAASVIISNHRPLPCS